MDEERVEQQEQEKPKGWKEKLFSEKCMKYINVLFILMLVLQIPPLTIAGYGLWLVYLICGIIIKKDTTLRIAYGVLGAFALAVIVLNVLAML